MSGLVSSPGWRVHFTRRELSWPRELPVLMTELAGLFAGLDERLDVLGVPEGRPFLVGPRGEYDVALNRYFAVWLAHSPANTQAAHARDLRTFLDFLWSARRRQGLAGRVGGGSGRLRVVAAAR